MLRMYLYSATLESFTWGLSIPQTETGIFWHQAHKVKIVFNSGVAKETYMRMDGEAWLQPLQDVKKPTYLRLHNLDNRLSWPPRGALQSRIRMHLLLYLVMKLEHRRRLKWARKGRIRWQLAGDHHRCLLPPLTMTKWNGNLVQQGHSTPALTLFESWTVVHRGNFEPNGSLSIPLRQFYAWNEEQVAPRLYFMQSRQPRIGGV